MEVIDLDGNKDTTGEISHNRPRSEVAPPAARKFFSLARSWTVLLENRSDTLTLLEFFIESAQILGFLFDPSIVPEDHSTGLLWLFQMVFPSVSLFRFSQGISQPAAIGIVYMAIGLPILCICLAGLTVFKSLKKSCVGVVGFSLTLTLSGVLYLPCLGVLLFSLTCDSAGSKMSPVMDCYGSQHLSLAIPALFGVLGVIFIATVYKALVYVRQLSAPTMFAHQSSGLDVTFHIVRTILCGIFVLVPQLSSGHVVYCAAYFVGTGLMFWKSMRENWTYTTTGEVWLRGFSATTFWAGICIAIPRVFYEDLDYFAIGFVCSLPLVLYLVYIFTAYEKLAVLTRSQHDLYKDESESLRFCIHLNRLPTDIASGAKHDLFALSSYVAYVAQHKGPAAVPIMNNPELAKCPESEKNIWAMRYILNRCLKSVTNKHRASVALKIFYIGFLMNDTKNYSLAWALTEQAARLYCSWTELFALFCIKKELKAKADSAGTGTKTNQFNAIVVMRQSQIEKKFYSLVEQAAKLYSRFWDLLQEKYPSNEAFEELGFAILQSKAQLEKSWEVLQRGASVPGNIIALYSQFVEQVEEDSNRAKQIKESLQSNRAASQNDFLMYYAGNGGAVVTVSALAQTHGFIKNYNGAFSRLTGYLQDELVNVPVETLIPYIYRAAHSAGLKRKSILIEAGEDEGGQSEKSLFILHKSQYLVPTVMKLVAAPNFLNGYVFIASFTAHKEWTQYNKVHFLLDPAKCIAGVTSNAQTQLGVDRQLVSDARPFAAVYPGFEKLSPEDVHEGVKLSQVAGIKRPVTLWWMLLRSNSGEELGYHVILTASNEEVQAAQPSPESKSPVEFAYSPEFNKYYQTRKEGTDNPSSKTVSGNSLSSGKKYSPYVSERLKLAVALPEGSPKIPGQATSHPKPKGEGTGFYQLLLDRLEEVGHKTGDYAFFNECKEKPDYGEGVATYRLEDGKFVKLAKTGIPMVHKEDPLFYDDYGNGNQRKKDYGSDKIIRSTIKSKTYLAKLLLGLPLPPSFNTLAFVTVACITISCGIGIAEYITFTDLFVNVHSELQLSLIQFKQVRCLAEYSTWLQQAVAVNEEMEPLENTYPRFKDRASFTEWTINKLEGIMDEFVQTVTERESIKHADLFTQMYSYKLDYSYNETEVIVSGIPLQMIYFLEMDDLYDMSSLKRLDQFTSKMEAIASYQHNYVNGLLPVITKALNEFVLTMNDLYMSQLWQTQLIVYICVGVICGLVLLQVPFVWSIDTTIYSQAMLFLRTPVSQCRAQQKRADCFLQQFKVGLFFFRGSTPAIECRFRCGDHKELDF